MSRSLLLTRRFAPLFWCQFFTAFSNNFFLNALVFLILFRMGRPDQVELIPLATAVFIAPYFFLSALGGELADRYDMARLAQRLKFMEIGVAIIALLGFLWHSVAILFAALLLFGMIAALFGPIKYGILPHLLTRPELATGNALVEGATFIAILLGTITGGLAVRYGGDHPVLVSIPVIVLSLMSWGASLFMTATGEAAPDLIIRRNILRSTLVVLKHLLDDRRIGWGALVMGWFWAVGAFVLALLPPLVKNVLGGTEVAVTVCLAIFSMGVAAGSGLAAWLAAGRITLLPTLVAAALIGLFAAGLGWTTLTFPVPSESRGIEAIFGSAEGVQIALSLAGLAISGGLFIVPVLAAVQSWAGVERRARVIAAVNILTAGCMTSAALLNALLQAAGMTPPALFILLGVGSSLVTVAIGCTMPVSLWSDSDR